MAFWGYFITYQLTIYTKPGAPVKPAWFKLLMTVFNGIRMIDASLIYIATAAFILSLKAAGFLSATASRVYVAFACLGVICSLLPDNAPGFLSVAGYLLTIPAYVLLLLYLMTVNLFTKEVTGL
jgi:hypothetical protein